MSSDLKGSKKGIGMKYAVKGIIHVFLTETNFRIHVFIMILTIMFGWFVKLTPLEWILVLFCITFVLVTEMINSAIELLIDYLFPQYHKVAGHIKDITAGSVLLAALCAIIVGFIIFIPKIVEKLC